MIMIITIIILIILMIIGKKTFNSWNLFLFPVGSNCVN